MSAKKKKRGVKVRQPSPFERPIRFDFSIFREGLAQLEREQWTAWAHAIMQEEKRITKKRQTRWKELMATNWEDLSEETKAMDYEFADKVIAMFAMNPFDNLVIIGEFILDAVYPEDIFFGSSDDPGVQYIDAMRQALRRIKEIRGEE
jgi:hypothetical protein